MQKWEQQAFDRMQEFDLHDLSNVLRAYVRLGTCPPVDLMLGWEKQAIDHMGQDLGLITEFTQDLSTTLCAYAMLGICPFESFMQKWEDLAFECIEEFTSQEVSTVIYAYAKLGICPPEKLKEKLESRIIGLLEGQSSRIDKKYVISEKDFSHIFHACAILNEIKQDDYLHSLAQKLYENRGKFKFIDKSVRRQFGHVCEWFGWEYDYEMPEEENCESLNEKRLKELFHEAGYEGGNGSGYVETIKHQIDVPISHKERDHSVEYDGPSHFVYKIDTESMAYKIVSLNGSTLLQTALALKGKSDLVLLRIPYPAADIIFDTSRVDKRIKMIKNIMSKVEEGEPGQAFCVSWGSKLNVHEMFANIPA